MSGQLSDWFNPSLFDEEFVTRTKADLSDERGRVVVLDDVLRADKLSLLQENVSEDIHWEIRHSIRSIKEHVSREDWLAAPAD